MKQERMHPDDLRAIMAAIVTDNLLGELARTAKPEAQKETTTDLPSPRVACGECEGGWLEESKTKPGVWGCLKCGRIAPRPFQIGDRVRRVNKDNTRRVPIGSTGTVKGADLWIRVEWDHDPNLGDPECNCDPENLQLIPNEPKEAAPASSAPASDIKIGDRVRVVSTKIPETVGEPGTIHTIVGPCEYGGKGCWMGKSKAHGIKHLQPVYTAIEKVEDETKEETPAPSFEHVDTVEELAELLMKTDLEMRLMRIIDNAVRADRERIKREIGSQFQPKGYIKTSLLLKILEG